jgi:hypothetical protein
LDQVRVSLHREPRRAARHYGVARYISILEFWHGDLTVVAEPPEFSGARLPPDHFFTGPLIPQDASGIATHCERNR